MNIFVTLPKGQVRDSFFTEQEVWRMNRLGTVRWNESDKQLTSQLLKEALNDTDVCFTGWGTVPFTAEVLEGVNQLQAIFHTGGSVATLVDPHTYESGIKVFSGNNIYARSVAEGVVAYALLSLRRLPHFLQEMKTKGWRNNDFCNQGLLGQTVGLVGFGSIAQYVVDFLRPFDTIIKVYSSYLTEEEAGQAGVQLATLEEIFCSCSVISIHSAQTPKTYHMITRQLLQSMQPGTLLINTARGSIIEESSLAEELKKGYFSAVLDVFEEEPLPLASPLRGLNNALLLPHMGGPTIDQRPRVTQALLDDLEALPTGPFSHEIPYSHAQRMTQESVKKQ